jgi:hypothetical protein
LINSSQNGELAQFFEGRQLVAVRFLKSNNNSIFFGNVPLHLVDQELLKEIKKSGVQYGRDRAS